MEVKEPNSNSVDQPHYPCVINHSSVGFRGLLVNQDKTIRSPNKTASFITTFFFWVQFTALFTALPQHQLPSGVRAYETTSSNTTSCATDDTRCLPACDWPAWKCVWLGCCCTQVLWLPSSCTYSWLGQITLQKTHKLSYTKRSE